MSKASQRRASAQQAKKTAKPANMYKLSVNMSASSLKAWLLTTGCLNAAATVSGDEQHAAYTIVGNVSAICHKDAHETAGLVCSVKALHGSQNLSTISVTRI